jgi:hypothetical protein
MARPQHLDRLPRRAGHHKRLRRTAALITAVIRMPAADTVLWSGGRLRTGGMRPVKDTVRRSDLAGVIVRVLQRILALTAAIWHDDETGAPVLRSLAAYDR